MLGQRNALLTLDGCKVNSNRSSEGSSAARMAWVPVLVLGQQPTLWGKRWRFSVFFTKSLNDSRLPGLAFANHHHSLPVSLICSDPRQMVIKNTNTSLRAV